MLQFALNRMTVPHMRLDMLVSLAKATRCAGIELRNDLATGLFDGLTTAATGKLAKDHDLTIHALAEVQAFNNLTDENFAQAQHLMDAAVGCGAPAVILIPQVGGTVPHDGLRHALEALHPQLTKRGLLGFVEPIGFASSTLRHKADAIAAINDLGMSDRFQLVHDTFHHFLVDEPIFADQTGLVHVSGVTNSAVIPTDMTDQDRGLVDANDRLGNIVQIKALHAAGYRGPISFEAFAPETHAITDPKAALLRSKSFIETTCQALAA